MAPTLHWGPTYDFAKFSEKLQDTEKFLVCVWGGGGVGGGRGAGSAPLDPPMLTVTQNLLRPL